MLVTLSLHVNGSLGSCFCIQFHDILMMSDYPVELIQTSLSLQEGTA